MDSVQLGRGAVEQVRDLLKRINEQDRRIAILESRIRVRRRLIDDILIAKPTATIAAISGTSVSSQPATVYEVDESNQLTATDRTIDLVYNWSATEITSGKTCVIGRCSRTGKWLVMAVDC